MPIEEKFAKQILAGFKRYEIRTKRTRSKPGTRAWLYATQRSRKDGVGAVLGSIILGECIQLDEDDLRRIAPEAASNYELLDRLYLAGRRPAYALEVAFYEKLRTAVGGTITGQGIRRIDDHALLGRLKRAASMQRRRPRRTDEIREHTLTTVTLPWLRKQTKLLLAPLVDAGWKIEHQHDELEYPPYVTLVSVLSRGRDRIVVDRDDHGNVTAWDDVPSGDVDDQEPPLFTLNDQRQAARQFAQRGWLAVNSGQRAPMAARPPQPVHHGRSPSRPASRRRR